MAITGLSLLGTPGAAYGTSFASKTPADYPAAGLLVHQFDTWQEGYEGAVVKIYRENTTELLKCYSDIFLTTEISNPQTLQTLETADGGKFGKFITHVYVPYAYELEINTSEQTGVTQVPLTDLSGENASHALVTPENGSAARKLREIANDRILTKNHGVFGSNPEANTTILNNAISEAATQGGGTVFLPDGTIVINPFNLPEDVVLVGEGIDTTILQCTAATNAVTITGDNAGLRDLTLDGINKTTYSVGIYGKDKDDISLTNVRVKRFQKGVQWQGGDNHVYKRLYIDDCTRCFLGHGDQDYTGGDDGDAFTGMDWFQGKVSNSTQSGIELLVRDNECLNNRIRQVDFDSNIGTDGAVLIYGARSTVFDNCKWVSNINNIVVQDNTDTSITYREVVGLYFQGGDMTDGINKFDGLCQDVIFELMNFDGTTFEANQPDNQILLRDCIESSTLFTGDATRISRWRTTNVGTIKGATTGATAVVAYSRTMAPNECVSFLVHATAERQNTDEHAVFLIARGAKCDPATLDYDNLTASFTAGDEVVGQTTGARGIIVSDSSSGSTGTLSLAAVQGDFADNEIITEVTNSGSARVNGTLIPPASVSLSGASKTSLMATGSNANNPPTGWSVDFVVNGLTVETQVTGAASSDVVWNLKIDTVAL